jgi:hypothetical protein
MRARRIEFESEESNCALAQVYLRWMARTSKANRIDPEAAHGKGIPADRFNLTDEERAMLADPDWVTEDDADAIISKRREREPGKNVRLEDVLRVNGFRLEH